MAIPNLGANTKSWRDLLDLRELQGVQAGLPLAPHRVCGPRYSRNNNEMFGVPPLRKSETSSKKKKMKKRKRRTKRQRKQRKQRKQKKKTTKKRKRKRKKTGKKLREKRRNGRRTGGGTDCEREPATQEGIFFLFD